MASHGGAPAEERRPRWTSSVGEVPDAQLHKLHRTKGVLQDLLNCERKL
jgi:hypothetical protein